MAGMYFRPISRPTPPPPLPTHTPDTTYFLPTSEKGYTFNPLEKNPNLVYLPSSINYNQYLKDVEEYQTVAQRASSPFRFGFINPSNDPVTRANQLLANLRQKYPNIGKPSEEDIARATPNVVAQVQQQAPAFVRSKATGAALDTISSRRRPGGRTGLNTIQGQATGLNPISSV